MWCIFSCQRDTPVPPRYRGFSGFLASDTSNLRFVHSSQLPVCALIPGAWREGCFQDGLGWSLVASWLSEWSFLCSSGNRFFKLVSTGVLRKVPWAPHAACVGRVPFLGGLSTWSSISPLAFHPSLASLHAYRHVPACSGDSFLMPESPLSS